MRSSSHSNMDGLLSSSSMTPRSRPVSAPKVRASNSSNSIEKQYGIAPAAPQTQPGRPPPKAPTPVPPLNMSLLPSFGNASSVSIPSGRQSDKDPHESSGPSSSRPSSSRLARPLSGSGPLSRSSLDSTIARVPPAAPSSARNSLNSSRPASARLRDPSIGLESILETRNKYELNPTPYYERTFIPQTPKEKEKDNKENRNSDSHNRSSIHESSPAKPNAAKLAVQADIANLRSPQAPDSARPSSGRSSMSNRPLSARSSGAAGNYTPRISMSRDSMYRVPADHTPEFDIWPPTGRTEQREFDSNLDVRQRDSGSITRPGLLIHLQTQLEEELMRVGSDGDDQDFPNEARFTAHREAFKELIRHMKVYGPFLSTILDEYESNVLYLQEKVDDLESKGLAEEERRSLKEEYEEKMRRMESSLRVQHDAELDVLRKQNNQLNIALEQLAGENVGLLKKIQDLELLLREVEDHTMLSEYLQAELDVERRNNAKLQRDYDSVRKRGDRFDQVQLDYEKLMAEMRELQEQLGSNVSARDYKLLRDRCDGYEKDMFQLKDKLAAFQSAQERWIAERVVLLDKAHDLDAYKKSSGSLTPRPEWNQGIPIHMPDVMIRLEGKRSQEVVDDVWSYIDSLRESKLQLQKELNEAKKIISFMNSSEDQGEKVNNAQFFIGLGTGPNVPPFLRYAGKIRNRQMKKRDLEILIKSVWKEKDQMKKQDMPLVDFFYLYLQKRNGVHAMIVEVAYNVLDACERFQYDADCMLFLRILKGELGQCLYYDEVDMLGELLEAFRKADYATEGKFSGTISKKSAHKIIRKVFPLKNKNDVIRIKIALEKDQPGSKVIYAKLFEEDREGNQGAFIECIRDQYLQDILTYHGDVQEGLVGADSEGTGNTNPSIIRDVIKQVDPKKSDSAIEEMIKRIPQVVGPDGRILWGQDVAIDAALRALKQGSMISSSPKKEEEDEEEGAFVQEALAASSMKVGGEYDSDGD